VTRVQIVMGVWCCCDYRSRPFFFTNVTVL